MKRPCDPDAMAEASGDARVVPSGAACRINALSTDVLLRAISFLEARQLVQTCVLSRRWRNLWRSVPRINASRDEFDGKAGTEIACDVLFKNFINRFLMLRNPVALHEFRLQYNIPDGSNDPVADSRDANLWIRHALQSNVRLIESYPNLEDNLEDRSFTCEHLEDRSFTCEHLVMVKIFRLDTYGEYDPLVNSLVVFLSDNGINPGQISIN
nr:unnamed protein product [Digitaria exilis]